MIKGKWGREGEGGNKRKEYSILDIWVDVTER